MKKPKPNRPPKSVKISLEMAAQACKRFRVPTRYAQAFAEFTQGCYTDEFLFRLTRYKSYQAVLERLQDIQFAPVIAYYRERGLLRKQ